MGWELDMSAHLVVMAVLLVVAVVGLIVGLRRGQRSPLLVSVAASWLAVLVGWIW